MSTPTVPNPSTEASADARAGRRPRVVVGLDGSEGARAALLWGMAEAARRGAELEIVSTFLVDFYWVDAYLLDPRRVDAVRADTEARANALVQEALRDPAVAAVPGSAGVVVHVLVTSGSPAEQLVHRARDADLLVIGSRGRDALRSTLLGSVALHCVAHAPCSVVVVHGAATPGTQAGTVVVGLDDSVMGRAAVAAAIAQAARLGATVEAVVAHDAPDHWSEMYTLMAPSAGETQEHALRRGEQIVAEVLEAEAPGTHADLPVPAVHVSAECGPAARVLVHRSEGAALLVVGSRSRSRITGMVLGSVALDCVVHAPCPVLVVRPAGRDRPPAAAATPAAGTAPAAPR